MKRIIALFISLIILLPTLSALAEVVGPIPSIVFRGDGTEDSPYLISTGGELARLSRAVSYGESFGGAYFVLKNDINLDGVDFSPIGPDEARPFAGSFDGRGFSISGLRLEDGADGSALFGWATGAISNIVLTDSVIIGGDLSAGIVAHGAAENCVSFASVTGRDRVGGIVGEGSAYDCVNHGTIAGRMEVGGVVGNGEAHRCENLGSVTGRTHAGGISGLGTFVDCVDSCTVSESAPIQGERGDYSVAAFIRWALKHVHPESIPTNAQLLAPLSSCGTEPWEYLYGSIRAATTQTTLNSFYNNYYTKFMLRHQYDELTDDWSRSTYATDCQGLLDAWLTYEAGVPTDLNAQMNWENWCTAKGKIEDIDRPWRIGEAVFIYSRRLGRMGHVGFICGFDENGEALAVEARGFAFGVVVTRVSDRTWTHRGLMTGKFYYDTPSAELMPCYDTVEETEPAFVPTESAVSEPRSIWDGTIGTSFAGGTGTASDPYLVSNGAELAYLSYCVRCGNTFSGKHIAMTADIWLNSTDGWLEWDYFNQPANTWIPIGSYETHVNCHAFSGSFDGRGHTVYGIFFSHNNKNCFGLFGYCVGTGSEYIKNVNVARSYMEASNNVGGIVGYLKNYSRVENCRNYGKIDSGNWNGGVVGYSTSSAGTTVVYGCQNSGSMRCSIISGGIVGCAHDHCTVSECVNREGALVYCYERGGGIVGGAWGSSVIKKCRNDGFIRGVDLLGGVVGEALYSTVETSYSGIDISSRYRTGGVAGTVGGGSITNCFNTGSVTAIEKVGGLVGVMDSSSLSLCYSVGTVSGRRQRGGAVGLKNSQSAVTSVYIPENCCAGGNDLGNAIPLASFAQESAYAGFDFTEEWIIDPETNYPFAELKKARYTSPLIPEYDPEPVPTAAPTVVPTVAPTPEPTPAPTFAPIDPPNPSMPPIDMPTPTPSPTPRPTPVASQTPSPFTGDVNGDGEVSINDALIVLRFAMGIISGDNVTDLTAGDVNQDGTVDALDALMILRMALGTN